MSPFFSIIVPAYNCEKSIEKCLNSILNQSFKDFELIVINDGSTDNTSNILTSFKDIVVINKENEGVSSSRNMGINIAQGKYTIFIDSDDWVSEEYLLSTHDVLVKKEIDILFLNYYSFLYGASNTKFVDNKINEGFYSKGDIVNAFLNREISNSPWDKIFRTSIIKKLQPFFPVAISLGEDSVAVSRAILNAEEYYVMNEAFYIYEFNHQSVTKSSLSYKKLNDVYKVLILLDEVYKDYSKDYHYMLIRQSISYISLMLRSEIKHDEIVNVFIKSIENIRLISVKNIKWKFLLTLLKLINKFIGKKGVLFLVSRLRFNL
ncbi:glycosyltransferase family 2 protein [Photobacterium angustum]|uniref:Glycosyltransferase 2-like domain-containing protein n=1 Tax=Photobacterium angustum TaxID=661 RepID=A0A2S7VXT2_PHOAN|nr:glycosyltransferase family 2 protein [Photobacterium angustum]PQJ66354.1 hypothetical protein BTO08_02425 [Photobacterium angustum]